MGKKNNKGPIDSVENKFKEFGYKPIGNKSNDPVDDAMQYAFMYQGIPLHPKESEPTIHFDKKVLESGLSFKEAYMRMVEGKKIARPSFIGFWYIDSFDGKMKIHDRFGNTLEKVDMTITVINTLANDWEVIE